MRPISEYVQRMHWTTILKRAVMTTQTTMRPTGCSESEAPPRLLGGSAPSRAQRNRRWMAQREGRACWQTGRGSGVGKRVRGGEAVSVGEETHTMMTIMRRTMAMLKTTTIMKITMTIIIIIMIAIYMSEESEAVVTVAAALED